MLGKYRKELSDFKLYAKQTLQDNPYYNFYQDDRFLLLKENHFDIREEINYNKWKLHNFLETFLYCFISVYVGDKMTLLHNDVADLDKLQSTGGGINGKCNKKE